MRRGAGRFRPDLQLTGLHGSVENCPPLIAARRRHKGVRMRSLRVLLALFALALMMSLVDAAEFKPGDKVELKPGDGLLAIDIDATGLVSTARLERVGSVFGGETLMNL